jgi:cytidyltransferase-like protein
MIIANASKVREVIKQQHRRMIEDCGGLDACKMVAVSGFFDPIHVGHLEYIKKAKELGLLLIAIVNSDAQAVLKKGKPFMKCNERMAIVDSLKFVDYVVEAVDNDGTVCETLSLIRPTIFAKGGDRILNEKNIPEYSVCLKHGIDLVDGLGAKIQSSSSLIKGAAHCQTSSFAI